MRPPRVRPCINWIPGASLFSLGTDCRLCLTVVSVGAALWPDVLSADWFLLSCCAFADNVTMVEGVVPVRVLSVVAELLIKGVIALFENVLLAMPDIDMTFPWRGLYE